jgi:hypothetical protein
MAAMQLREMDARTVGRGVGQFGIALIAAFIVACVLAETVVVDFLLPMVFVIAFRIRDRSVGAAKAAVAFVGAYCLGLLSGSRCSITPSSAGGRRRGSPT